MTTEQHQGCKDIERSGRSNLTINHLPDELLLEIFDSYRQSIGHYDHRWRKKHVWLNLTHVCRKWRAVTFASSSRLDLGITIGPEKPGHIKTILSGHLPLFIDYRCMYKEITGRALWRLRTALKHQDRVREITFKGTSAWFDEFFKATDRSFPVLENLSLQRTVGNDDPKIPDTFLRGPDLSDLHLQRLSLQYFSFASISQFLSSTTALTGLILKIDTAFTLSPETSLLACLQGLPCLRSLNLYLSSSRHKSPPRPSTSKDIVSLSKLTRLRYSGHSVFLDALVAGLSVPSIRVVDITQST